MNRMSYVEIAKLCHQVNRAYCKALGDESHMGWDDAPDWQKESAIRGVEMHLTNKNMSPEDSHKSWLKLKEDEGWVYGEEKNVELKTHPCMLPYRELPTMQRAKDHIFKAICDYFRDAFNEMSELPELPEVPFPR